MFENQTNTKEQQQKSLEKLLDQIRNSTEVIPGPLLRIFNRHNIALEIQEIISKIQELMIQLSQSQKNYVKDVIAIEWFIDISILILHLSCKQKKLIAKMQMAFQKAVNFRKIKSLMNQQVKDIIIIKSFADLCFLQLHIERRQYLQVEVKVRNYIVYYSRYEQPLIKIPMSQFATIKFIIGQIMHNKISSRSIYKALQLRREVVLLYKQYFDRAILAFYISDTMCISMKLFQAKNDLSGPKQKADFISNLYQDICTKAFFGQSIVRNLKNRYFKIINAEVTKATSNMSAEILKESLRMGSRPKYVFNRNKSCNSALFQIPVSTKLHKQPYRSLHRSNCNQMSIIKHLLKPKQKKIIDKTTYFTYNVVKQNQKPIQKSLNLKELQEELQTITNTNKFSKRPLVSLGSFKARKNSGLASRRLKRVSMVLQQQNLGDSTFLFPIKFTKYLNRQISSIEVIFSIHKDEGSINLVIKQPQGLSQVIIFKMNQSSPINSGQLMTRYKQQIQNSMYYYEFFDGVRDEIESTDIPDAMLSELILEYHGRLDRKLLSNYILLKQYIIKYIHWKHLRKVNKLCGYTYKMIPIPEVHDFLKFTLYLQNIIKSEKVTVSANPLSKSKIKKSMFPIVQYLSDSRYIVTKVLKKQESSYFLDVVVSNETNIKLIQMVEGAIEVHDSQYSLKSYYFRTLDFDKVVKPFIPKSVSDREIISGLLFTGCLTKSANLRLFNQLTQKHDTQIFNGKQCSEHGYQKSLTDDQKVTLLDETNNSDEKISTPNLTGQIQHILNNRNRQIPMILCLLNFVLQQSLRHTKAFQVKLLYKTTKYFRTLGYFHVTIMMQKMNGKVNIIFKFQKTQLMSWHLFKIEKVFLQKIFPKFNYEQIVNQIVVNDQQQHKKLLMKYNNIYIRSFKNHQNRPALLNRRKIYTKTIRSQKKFLIITVFYNSAIKNWEIQLYDQHRILLQVAFINILELGLIVQNIMESNSQFSKIDLYAILLRKDSIDRHDYEEVRVWMQILNNSYWNPEENNMVIFQVILHFQTRICLVNIGKKWIDVCLDHNKSLQNCTFSIYGYQQSREFIYSTTSFIQIKKQYILDYYFKIGNQREMLLKFARYIAQKIDNQQYDSMIYLLNPGDYITRNIQVMKNIISLKQQNRNDGLCWLSPNLEHSEQSINKLVVRSYQLKDDDILLWMKYKQFESCTISSDLRILDKVQSPEFVKVIENVLMLS